MPMMNKTPGKELPTRSVREIEEMIGTIEQYLQQTREVFDRIEKSITELRKKGRIKKEKNELIHPGKDPAEEMGIKL